MLNIPNTFEPGDVIRFDFRVLTDDPAQVQAATHEIKTAVWSHPRLNYSGSRLISVGNLELQREVYILQVYATVRPYDKAVPGTVRYETLTELDAYIRMAADKVRPILAVIRTNVGSATAWAAEMAEALPQTGRNFSIAALLIAAVIAYAWFFGLPKHLK